MSSIRYCAAWTECGCLVTCGHSHESVGEAVACIQCAGGYVVAVDAGTMSSLNNAEEVEFQIAIHNFSVVVPAADTPAVASCTAIDSLRRNDSDQSWRPVDLDNMDVFSNARGSFCTRGRRR